MSFTDTGVRSILAGMFPDKVTLAAACKKGDLLGYSTGWKLADADTGPIYASCIAAIDGAIGDTIPVWRAALVDGFAGGTPDADLYLSNTGGKFAASAGTNSQIVGRMQSVTAGWVDFRTAKSALANADVTAGAAIRGSKLATNARRQHFTCPTVLDLSGAAQAEVVQFFASRAITIIKVVLCYVEASSSNAGVTVQVGKNGDADWFYTGTSEISKSLYYAKDVTLLHAALAAGEVLTISNAGGKTGTGNIKVHIEFVVDD